MGLRWRYSTRNRASARDHLALLIATGYLNNIVLDAACCRVLVMSRTYKESIPVVSHGPDVEIEREVLRTSVVALDLRSGRFEVIERQERIA